MHQDNMADCIVLGAGGEHTRVRAAEVIDASVVGLSAALNLVERGFQPVILARDLPEDLDSISFASPWAVSHVVLLPQAADQAGCQLVLSRYQRSRKEAGPGHLAQARGSGSLPSSSSLTDPILLLFHGRRLRSALVQGPRLWGASKKDSRQKQTSKSPPDFAVSPSEPRRDPFKVQDWCNIRISVHQRA